MSDDYEDFAEAEDEDSGADDMEVDASAGDATPVSSGGDEEGRHLTELEEAEQLTVSAKDALRRQMEEQIQKFLQSGGQIQEVPPDVSADPPRKPESSYGSKPI
ncbi:MAG: hypothetical protein HKM02_03055 [Pseudomonadales bacterium]|nr:hypothetical protein [Pseudomonadales bacterium]